MLEITSARVVVTSPGRLLEARKIVGKNASVSFADGPLAALDGADALIIVTEWKEFRSPDFDEIKKRLKQPVVFDGRNLYEPALVRIFGLEYHAIGRGDGTAAAARLKSA